MNRDFDFKVKGSLNLCILQYPALTWKNSVRARSEAGMRDSLRIRWWLSLDLWATNRQSDMSNNSKMKKIQMQLTVDVGE